MIKLLNFIKNKIFYLFLTSNHIDEDDRRREFILNVILCSFFGFLFFLSLIFIYNALNYSIYYKIISFFSVLLIWSSFVTIFYLSKKGYIKTASYGLIFLITIFSTIGSIEWGFDLPAVIISYLLIIVIASILFDAKIGMYTTIILSLLIYFIGYYQIKIQAPQQYWRLEKPEVVDIFTYFIELSFIMAISWLSNNEMRKSLIRARTSEEKLSLELEKISRVYHFAEFGKLSSGAFHDLINPLTSISVSINELENSINPNISKNKVLINTAIRASKRMGNFILAIEKQIRPDENINIFSINDEIEQAIELISYKARRGECEIFFSANKNINYYGNFIAFYQTITNLLSNAIDSYDLIQKKFKPIYINLKEKSKNITIEIKDNGTGIKKDVLNKIFDPFFTTKPFHKGMGLGLSSSKEKIEKEFGGTISVISEADQGTTFTITIPKKDSPKTS